MPEDVEIRLPGQTKRDVIGLKEVPGLKIQKQEIPGDTHGELTTFVVIVTLAGISALSAYLLRKHNRRSFTETLEVTHPDGRIERRTVHWDQNSVEAPDSAIIKQIRGV